MRLYRLRGIALALALAGCAPDGDGARYLGDRAFRRAALEASLVSTENRYARLRLDHYASGRAGDWDALPTFNPPVATVGIDGRARDDEAALAIPGLDGAALVRAGEEAFFRYPVESAAFAEAALGDGALRARAGLWTDEARGVGLVWARFADGTRGLELTCATCHARVAGGRLVAGLANQALDLAAPDGAGAHTPGRIDVALPSGEEPVAIPDLRPVALETHLHRDGTLRNSPIALAVRLETLIVTAHAQVVRPPRELVLALAAYLAQLAPEAPSPSSHAERRGEGLFQGACAGCHSPPAYAGPPVPLAVAGTDPRVGESADRGTGGYRVPSLRGVASRGALLHDASVPDLETLLDPARTQPGHAFGLSLTPEDRADLLAFLRAL